MRIAIEGCLHGELEKVYKTIQEIESKNPDQGKVDLLLCCGDFQACRNLIDLKTMAVPDKFKEMGSFYKYYSGELKAPMLTLVIGGNHEASNHLQELPYGGWLCPNIYYLGYCNILDIVDNTGNVILTIGGLSGIYKAHDYLKGRFERPPYSENSKRSVYHVRNVDTFRLKSMPIGSIDIMMSHDWPVGITKFGNEEQLLRKKPFFREDIEKNDLGSPPAMEILQYLKPKYWFSGHLHVKFAAIYEEVTKFLALDKCLPQRRFLQVISIGESSGPLKLRYNPKWLTILKSTNHLQSSSTSSQHMPGKGYSGGRFDYSPTPEELSIVKKLFNEDFDIPLNFKTTAKVFDPNTENLKQMHSLRVPEAEVNFQTEFFCEKLGIDDPISLIDQESSFNQSSSLKLSDLADENMTFQITKNDDEILIDDETDSDEEEVKKSPDPGLKKSFLNLPKPKNLDDSKDEEKSEKNSSSLRKSFMNLPPPKNSDTNEPLDKTETEKSDEKVEPGPQKKTFKRRNASIYTTNED